MWQIYFYFQFPLFVHPVLIEPTHHLPYIGSPVLFKQIHNVVQIASTILSNLQKKYEIWIIIWNEWMNLLFLGIEENWYTHPVEIDFQVLEYSNR